LIRNYGHVKGKFLADLAYGIDDRDVVNVEQGSRTKSVSTERSFQPRSLDGSAELTALLEALAVGLLERVKEKKVGETNKVESLTVGGRKGYDVTKSCKGNVPERVVAWCLATMESNDGIHEASQALVRETLSRLRQLFGRNEKVTRVSLTLSFDCQSAQSTHTTGLLAVPDMSVTASKPTYSVERTPVTYRNKHASEVERLFSNTNDACATMLAPSNDQDEALAYKLQREEVMLARGKRSETSQEAVGKRRNSKTSNMLESFVIRKKLR
jgi:hypothetical protein